MPMLTATGVHATLPAKDLERAKSWYADKLGLKPSHEKPWGLMYQIGHDRFLLFQTEFAGTAQNTQATFDVDDVEATVATLRENGVAFEEFDIGDFKTVDGIATMGPLKVAWFKDSEGNTVALGNTEAALSA